MNSWWERVTRGNFDYYNSKPTASQSPDLNWFWFIAHSNKTTKLIATIFSMDMRHVLYCRIKQHFDWLTQYQTNIYHFPYNVPSEIIHIKTIIPWFLAWTSNKMLFTAVFNKILIGWHSTKLYCHFHTMFPFICFSIFALNK